MQEILLVTQGALAARMPRVTIHQRIRQRREQLGLSLQDVGSAVGVSWQTVQQWEKTTAPKRARLEAAALALKTTPEWLLFGEDHATTAESENRMTDTAVGNWPLGSFITPEQWATLTAEQQAAFAWEARKIFSEVSAATPAAGKKGGRRRAA